MRGPAEDGAAPTEPGPRAARRPGVYARLAQEADVRHEARAGTRGARWAGWALCAALAAAVVAGAAWANPW